jgi:hypothetical protein
MKTKIIYLILLYVLSISCNDSNLTENQTPISSGSEEWLIPKNEVKDGGPGKDGIPSIEQPKFTNIDNVGNNLLSDDDFVIGIVKDNEAKAYPHFILDWHEIVNDKINEDFITVNYCPLTGTAFGWESSVNGQKSTFGVSGLLYNTNLILYDRNTDSNWSQLRLQCVNGSSIGKKPILINVVETNWGTWKKLYPNTKVLSTDTGFSRNYANYPYGDYRTNQNFFLFTASPSNDALPNKERIYAILDGDKSKVYQFSKFNNGKVFKDEFNGKNYLIVGNENLITAFELTSEHDDLNFEYDFNNSISFFKDNEGNKWSVFGKATEGPRVGQELKMTRSVVSFWFAIASFYPNPEIYQ